ncbi:unnamed protein product [Arctogadus glacialis]
MGQLKNIYKDCKYPGSGEGVGGKPTAATCPWFVPMDEVLGQRHSTNPPVLIASISENTPEPSTAVVDQEVEDKDQEDERQRGPRSRKRDREEDMFQSRSLSSEKDSRLTCSESTSTLHSHPPPSGHHCTLCCIVLYCIVLYYST